MQATKPTITMKQIRATLADVDVDDFDGMSFVELSEYRGTLKHDEEKLATLIDEEECRSQDGMPVTHFVCRLLQQLVGLSEAERRTAWVEFDADNDLGVYLSIHYIRALTDEEKAERAEAKQRSEEAQTAREKKQLEELLAKFGDAPPPTLAEQAADKIGALLAFAREYGHHSATREADRSLFPEAEALLKKLKPAAE